MAHKPGNRRNASALAPLARSQPAVPHVWDRQPLDDDAPPEAWAAYQAWLASGPPRLTWSQLTTKLCELYPRPEGYELSTVAHWAREYYWSERATEFDRYNVGRYEQAVLSETAQARALRHLTSTRHMHEVGSAALASYLARARAGQGLPDISPKDAVRMVQVAIQLERLIYGETTEHVEHTLDLGALTVEEIEVMRRLTVKAGKG